MRRLPRLRNEDARTARRQRRREIEELRLRHSQQARLDILDAISEALDRARDRLEDTADLTEERLAQYRSELSEAMERVRERRGAIRARTAGTYRRSLRLLRGNPSAIAKEFGEALESLRSLDKDNRK